MNANALDDAEAGNNVAAHAESLASPVLPAETAPLDWPSDRENWDFVLDEPAPGSRWTQEVTFVCLGRERPGQMVFPDEVCLDEIAK
ncbi:MAG: hypothetical protein K1X57_00595 [Gemmataceae bacterium]|nr:hypothetical protein [Gemmataceae bacterium]